MSDLDALLAGIVADPANALRWLVMADWLEDHGFPERAELVRVHRELLRTCTEPDASPERPQLHARMMELMRAGVQPCLPQKTLTLPGGVELRMSFIPPGSFLMGSPETEEGRDEHETLRLVTLTRGFWLGQTPTTQIQWAAMMSRNPSYHKGDDLPVESVSWDETEAYCLSIREQTGQVIRLPTEAEWEYAARSGTTTPFYWGEELNGTQANCYCEYPYGTEVQGPCVDDPTPAGSYAAISPHPWGLIDLLGDVWEWCAAWHSASSSQQENAWNQVYRGGCWANDPTCCRAACRGRNPAVTQSEFIGFRIAADLE